MWHRIVAVAANQQFAAAPVSHLLHERLTDALRCTAMDLTFHKQGVNDELSTIT